MSSTTLDLAPSLAEENPTPSRDLWLSYSKTGAGSASENSLIEQYLPLVKAVVGRLAMTLPSHVNVDDLYSAGLVGLLNAVRRFDLKTGSSFEHYARLRIRGAVFDELRRLDWVPRSVHEKAKKVAKIMQQLSQRDGAVPSDVKMARAMNLSLADYEDLLEEIRPASYICLDAVQDEHWTEAAAFFDSTDVSANRLPSLKALLGWAQGGALTAARQPAGTPFRGGFNWARDTSKLETYDTVAVVTAAGSTTIGALARLSPEAFLATSLAARLGQPRPVAASQVVGFVTEGDSVAHVVFRTQYLNSRFATPPTQRELLHMRRVSGRWMIIPTSPFVSAGDMAAAAMNYRPPRTSN